MTTSTYQLINQVSIQKEYVSLFQNYFQVAQLEKYVEIVQERALNGEPTFYLLSKVFTSYELTAIHQKLAANSENADIPLMDLLKVPQSITSTSFGEPQVKVTQLSIQYESLNSLKGLLSTVSTDLLRIETHVSTYGTSIYLLSDLFTYKTLTNLVAITS